MRQLTEFTVQALSDISDFTKKDSNIGKAATFKNRLQKLKSFNILREFLETENDNENWEVTIKSIMEEKIQSSRDKIMILIEINRHEIVRGEEYLENLRFFIKDPEVNALIPEKLKIEDIEFEFDQKVRQVFQTYILDDKELQYISFFYQKIYEASEAYPSKYESYKQELEKRCEKIFLDSIKSINFENPETFHHIIGCDEILKLVPNQRKENLEETLKSSQQKIEFKKSEINHDFDNLMKSEEFTIKLEIYSKYKFKGNYDIVRKIESNIKDKLEEYLSNFRMNLLSNVCLSLDYAKFYIEKSELVRKEIEVTYLDEKLKTKLKEKYMELLNILISGIPSQIQQFQDSLSILCLIYNCIV